MPYPVTQDFNDQMKAIQRRTYGKVAVDYTDPFLDQSIAAAANEEAAVSYPGQTADSVAAPFAKILSLDGSCVLDGSYRLAPETPEQAATHQMGWWGAQLAGVGRAFAEPYPALTVTHNPRPVHALKVTGDSMRGEWPMDFTVQLYAQDDTLLRTESVAGNTEVAWSMTLPAPVLDVARQVLTITKWSHAGRQAKIVEFFTSIQEVYEGAGVIRLKLLEEREVGQGSLPIGNISANELDLRLDNSTRKFDAGNTSSPLYGVVKANRRIRAWVGTDAENIESPNPATFTRPSTAYHPETGAEVAVDEPRYMEEPFEGKQAILAEEGTANLVSPSWNPVMDNDHQTVVNTGETRFGQPVYRCTKKTRSTYPMQVLGPFTVANGASYTATMYVRQHQAPSWSPSFMIFYSAPIEYARASISVVDEWVRLTVTYTNNTGADIPNMCVYFYGSGEVGDVTDFCAPQVENKPYATSPYTPGGARATEVQTTSMTGVLTAEGSWTIEMLLRPDRAKMASTSRTAVLEIGRYFYQNETSITMMKDGPIADKLELWIHDNRVAQPRQVHQRVPSDWDTPMFLALRYDGATMKMDTFGDSAGHISTQRSTAWANPVFNLITIGGYYNAGAQINGPISSLRISSKARSDAEILAAYQRFQAGLPLEKDEWTTRLYPFNGSVYPVERCWVPLGTFWSGDWSAPEDEVGASTAGRDRLGLLGKDQEISSVVEVDKTLRYLAVQVFTATGLRPEEYWVDPELDDFTVPYAYFESQPPREALRKIVEACLGQAYCDRYGVLRVEGPSFLASKTASDWSLSAEDYFRKDNPAKYSEIANYIEVETSPLRPAVSEEAYRSNDPVPIAAGQTIVLTVHYNTPPCIEALASLEGQPVGCVITDADYFASGATVTVSSPTNAGSFTLVIDARPLTVLNRERAVAQDAASITDNGKMAYRFPDNPLVQTLPMAQAIADALLASYKDPRRDVEMEWRGNPAVLLADRATVADRNEERDYFVTRQELEWAGALRARMSGRRAT